MERGAVMQCVSPEWFFFNEDRVPVSTFIPAVVSVVKAVVGSDIEREDAQVKLCFKDGSSTKITVQLSAIDSVDWFAKDHRCIVNHENRQAGRYIADTIRAGISNAPVVMSHVLDRAGIHHINNTIVFAAGDRAIAPSLAAENVPNFELDHIPFRLDIDESISSCEAINGMMELMSLSREIGPVIVAHVISGIMRAAFMEAGLTPCSVLVVVGESGMLKSHCVPHLAQLYNRADRIGPVTRFNSTTRFIEDTLYEHSECTAVIDDLHTAQSKGIKRQNENTAEEIIRRISDDTGRGRINGNSQVQRHFRGNVIFIGEYIIGKASTIPRALVVNLTEPPNGAILDKYQRQQPLVVSTFYYYFIQWYVDHFNEVRDAIDVALTKLRKASMSSATHGRLRDTRFCLQTAYKFFCEFCKDSEFCSEADAVDTYNSFSDRLNALVRTQQAQFNESVEGKEIDYLALIRKLYKQGRFRVAKSVEDFNPQKHDGLIYYDNCLCLRGKCLKRELRSVSANLNIDDCVQALLHQEALKLVGSKYTVQITGTSGIRFYAIKRKKMS